MAVFKDDKGGKSKHFVLGYARASEVIIHPSMWCLVSFPHKRTSLLPWHGQQGGQNVWVHCVFRASFVSPTIVLCVAFLLLGMCLTVDSSQWSVKFSWVVALLCCPSPSRLGLHIFSSLPLYRNQNTVETDWMCIGWSLKKSKENQQVTSGENADGWNLIHKTYPKPSWSIVVSKQN